MSLALFRPNSWLPGAVSVGTHSVSKAVGHSLHSGCCLGCKALLAIGCPQLPELPGSAGLHDGGGRILRCVAACLGFLQNAMSRG